MNGEKNSTEEKVKIILTSQLELRHRVVFVMCQNQLIKARNDCSRLVDDEAFKSLPPEQRNEGFISLSTDEKLELFNSIITNIEDVKNTLWAAVLSSNSDERTNSNTEG